MLKYQDYRMPFEIRKDKLGWAQRWNSAHACGNWDAY